jgi:hypothetical protein
MGIIEVLSIEASKGDHAATNEASAVSTSWLRVITLASSDF